MGVPGGQKPWFSPEYVAWLYKHPSVWGFDLPADMPGANMIPHDALRKKYGDYNFTSSLAWMMGMAIDAIQEARERGDTGEHTIGMWGVDMAAESEYGYQRSGCQYFCQIAKGLGIEVILPMESDVMTPPALYGLSEKSHRSIKLQSRAVELAGKLAHAKQQQAAIGNQVIFLEGAIEDLQYMRNNWDFDGDPNWAEFGDIFGKTGESFGNS